MKKTRMLIFALVVSVVLSVFMPVTGFALEDPELNCRNAILVDAAHDEVLYEKDAYAKAYPASITKVMTALLVLEAIDAGQLTADTPVTASAQAVDIPWDSSTAGIKEGEVLTVEQLLYCLLLPSANEAAKILAETVGGTEAAFVERMNQRAQELGCQGTHFVNPNGLHDDDHYTTAYDISLFMKAAMEYDLFRTIISKPNYEIPPTNKTETKRIVRNTNGLVSNWTYLGYLYLDKGIGGKTGSTEESGSCLVQAAEDENNYLISVVLGAEIEVQDDGTVKRWHFLDTIHLLDWGFDNFRRTTISEDSDPVTSVTVTLSSETDQVMLKPSGTITRTLPKDVDLSQMEREINRFSDTVEAPVAEGDVLGTMTLSYEGEVYGTVDLVAVTSVERSELLYRLNQIENFFRSSGVKLILAIILLIVVVVLLRVLVFRKRRRHYSGVGGGRRGRYSGRRR